MFEGRKEGLPPIDKQKAIRGINSIIQWMKMYEFPIDYSKEFKDVVDDLYIFTTTHSNSLDLICRPWCPDEVVYKENRRALPTWVRPLSERAFDKNKIQHKVDRVNC